MAIITRCLLSKSDLAGWEIMDLFAGGVNQSDKFFNVIIFLVSSGPFGPDRAVLMKILITLGIYHHHRKVARG